MHHFDTSSSTSRGDWIRTSDHTPPRGILLLLLVNITFDFLLYVVENQENSFY